MIIDPLTSSIITGIAVSLFAGIILALLRRRWQNIDRKRRSKEKAILEKELKEELKSEEDEFVKKSIWRLNKTVLIMAKIIDDQTEKAHGELNSSLEDIATELLKETDKS